MTTHDEENGLSFDGVARAASELEQPAGNGGGSDYRLVLRLFAQLAGLPFQRGQHDLLGTVRQEQPSN